MKKKAPLAKGAPLTTAIEGRILKWRTGTHDELYASLSVGPQLLELTVGISEVVMQYPYSLDQIQRIKLSYLTHLLLPL